MNRYQRSPRGLAGILSVSSFSFRGLTLRGEFRSHALVPASGCVGRSIVGQGLTARAGVEPLGTRFPNLDWDLGP